jgi:hypothetical protein
VHSGLSLSASDHRLTHTDTDTDTHTLRRARSHSPARVTAKQFFNHKVVGDGIVVEEDLAGQSRHERRRLLFRVHGAQLAGCLTVTEQSSQVCAVRKGVDNLTT